MLDQLSSISFTATTCLGTNIVEVPGVIITLTKHFCFGLCKKGKEFLEESDPTFFAEFVIQPPHATTKHGEEVIDVLAGRHPHGNAIKIWTYGCHKSFKTVGVGHIFHGFLVKCKSLLFSPVCPIGGIDSITDDMIIFEGFSETLGCLLVFVWGHDTNLAACGIGGNTISG